LTSLEFKLTTRFNTEKLSRKLRKDWLSTCHRYRITWRKQFMGVSVLPRYYAMRLNRRPDGTTFWDFALDSERRPYETYKRAYQACCKAAGIQLEEELPKRRKKKEKKYTITISKSQLLSHSHEDNGCDISAGVPTLAQDLPIKRKRGRPKGSKNKPKDIK